MIYTVETTETVVIDFAPATVAEEVGQNIRTLISTHLYSCPGAREIGVDYSTLLDEPITVARARLTGIITEAIMEQEPRAEILSIEFVETEEEASLYGKLRPVIRYRLAEGV